MNFIGESAALFTSFCWSLSAIGFSMAGRKFSSQVINRLRVSLAFLVLLVVNGVLYGKPIPVDAGLNRWGWLTLSGIIGLALGDYFLFRCYQLVGARIGLLLLSLSPVFGALLAGIFFGETLNAIQLAGMVIALGGIGWVVLSRQVPRDGQETTHFSTQGILYGIIAAFGQAAGLALSRLGMGGNFPPFAGTLIRMTAAIVFLWGAAVIQKQVKDTAVAARTHTSSLGWVTFGALFGPVIGVSASLLAIQHSSLGVASTLMALPPVFMLPISYFIFKERFGWRSVAGTLLAILGVALLFIK